jgi:hypothetical protein
LWLIAGGWFVLREKYCWLVADKPSEQGEKLKGRSSEGFSGQAGQTRDEEGTKKRRKKTNNRKKTPNTTRDSKHY